jgi:hypothetical protein
MDISIWNSVFLSPLLLETKIPVFCGSFTLEFLIFIKQNKYVGLKELFEHVYLFPISTL